MERARYIIGIDLGTTNCAVAYADLHGISERELPEIQIFEISQVVSPGSVERKALLPSFVYQAVDGELPEGSMDVPWHARANSCVGIFARDRGAEVPDQVVSSSKSWLSYSGMDRTAMVLPLGAPDGIEKMSPIKAAAKILSHIRSAWNHTMAGGDPALCLEAQEIYLTVPASFDATARELTAKAAEMAGIPRVTLLEEPQAAFYAWIQTSHDAWRDQVSVDDVVLVCDVGGGTTDFSLILVSEEAGQLALERVAVGDHILLGGDNIDLTLAFCIQERLAKDGVKLDNWQMRGLFHSARRAKEELFVSEELKSHPVTILGKGRRIIGGTITTELTRADVEHIVLEGFFPRCEPTARPEQVNQAGLQELGLPYASDPAVTKHLAWFLQRHRPQDSSDEFLTPTGVLFNGGVMKAKPFQDRVIGVLDSWRKSGVPSKVLTSNSLDLAVARGSAYYGLARQGRGIRIRSGTERSYYVGVQTAMPAIPGMATPIKALCVAPFGMEEGTEAKLSNRRFGLIVGRPVSFRFFGSTTRHDNIGDSIEDWQDAGIEELVPIETELPAPDGEEGKPVSVYLQVKVTEIGTLELWFVSETNRWKLEFNVRHN